MKKILLATIVVVFSGACAHKAKAPEANDTKTPAAATKDQVPAEKAKNGKKAVAAAAATAGADSVKCKHNSDERTLEVKAKDGGCETVYTKMGEAKAVATSANGKQHCHEVSEKIQKNLTAAGFSCQ